MKKIIVSVCSAAILASVGLAGAEGTSAQKAPEDFATKKANILQRMDEREKVMAQKRQEVRACVEAAKSNEDLRVCRHKMRAGHEEGKERFREKMEQRKQQQ